MKRASSSGPSQTSDRLPVLVARVCFGSFGSRALDDVGSWWIESVANGAHPAPLYEYDTLSLVFIVKKIVIFWFETLFS